MSDKNLIDFDVEKRFSDAQIPNKLEVFQEELIKKKQKNKKLFNLDDDDDDDDSNDSESDDNFRPTNLDELIKLESPFFKVRENNQKYYKKIKNVRSSELKEKNPYDDENDENSLITQTKKNIELKENTSFSTSSRNSSFSSKNSLVNKPIFEIEVFDSLFKTILQIINVIIKYSLVQIAYCMKVLGIFWGPLTLVSISLLSLLSLHILLEVHKRTGERNYLIFSEKSFGKFGKISILVINFISSYGSCCLCIIICLKVIPKILTLSLGNKDYSGNTYISLILALILFFFCFRKDVTGIKKAAQYGVFGIILFFIITIIDFLYSVYKRKDVNESIVNQYIIKKNYFETEDIYEVITAISTIILCYTYHSFTFSIYGCLGNITLKQYFITASVTVFLCTFIYLICGVLGYLLYSDEIKDTILDGIGNDALNSLLSLCNVASVIMSFPISFSGLKNYFLFITESILTILRNLYFIIFGCFKCVKINKNSIKKKGKKGVKLNKYFEFFLVLVLYVSIFVIANIFQKLKIIFSVLGGIMGNIFSFIFPALFYIFLGRQKNEMFSLNIFISSFLIIFGAITLLTCLYSTIREIFGNFLL